MSTDKKNDKIAIFHNLPNGGGIRMLNSIIRRYSKKIQINLYVVSDIKPKKINGIKTIYIPVKPWKGFILRNLWIMLILPLIHRKLAYIINRNYKFAFVTHDYFTKSPYLLRYLKINNIYLCQEPQREYYESWSMHAPKLIDKITTILRYPIKLIDQSNTRYARKIICNSKYSKAIIKKVYKTDCEVVYPGVDEKFFTPGKSIKEKLILCVGGINPVKNQAFLISSLNPILNKYKLILVGDGKNEYISSLIDENNNKRQIMICRNISDNKLRTYYRKAMVTCITAHGEPFGLSSIESQSCGTPVVSVSEGGPIETIIDGETGYLVNRNSSEYLCKVKRALGNFKKLGKNARKNIINGWTWNKTLNNLDKYLI